MKNSDLKKKTIKELRKMGRELQIETGEMKFSIFQGKKIKQVHMIKKNRRTIARINTEITRKKMNKVKI